MPFAPRSFGTGRPSLIKPSSAAMQQFRGGSPSVAPVPLRMPARPPVANRMQQYNTPPQMPPGRPGGGQGTVSLDDWVAQEKVRGGRSGPFVPPPMPREMPTPPGGGGVMKMPETGGYRGGQGTYIPGVDAAGKPIGPPKAGQWIAQDESMQPGGGFGMPGQTIPGTNQNGTRYGSQPAPPGGGYSPVPPATTMPRRFGGFSGGIFEEDGAGGMRVIEPGPGNELGSTGQRGMPKYDPRGMGGGEMSQPGGGGVMIQQPGGGTSPYGGGGIGSLDRTQAFKRGGQIQAYAKGGRVMAKPVAKKAVKTSTTSSASSRGDGIAQRGKTKGKMR